MKPPVEPPFSCPNLDQAIAEIENARTIATELRKWGEWWKDRAAELEKEYDKSLQDKNDVISELKDQIETKDELIIELKQETRDMRTELNEYLRSS